MEDSLENEPSKEGLDGANHDETANDEGGELGDEAGLEVGQENWDEKADRDEGENGGDDAKESHGTIGAIKTDDSEDDFDAVFYSV